MTREEAIRRIKARFDKWALDDEDLKALQALGLATIESEDEKIIRAIIDALYSHTNSINLLSSRGYQMEDIEAWLEKQKEEEGYEAIPVESTLEYKLGFKAGKESEKQKDLTTENIYKHSRERMSFWNGQQKEQKPVSNPKWAELTWKDINELERIINNVHYEFQNGIGEDSFGELVLERFKEYKDDGSMDEQKPAECERQPEFKEVEYDFRGEKVKVMRPFFRDDKGREFSTTGRDTDLIWSVLREWCEIKGITPYDLYPREEWSEEDEKYLDDAYCWLCEYAGSLISKNHEKSSMLYEIANRLKSFRPPQDRCKDCPHRGDMFLLTQGIKSGKHELASEFMNYLDENRPEEKTSLSNAECKDIDEAFKECDWAKIMRYVEKYSPSWKPSEHQMTILKAVKDYVGKGSGYWGEGLGSLIDDLEKLM